jgi:putative Holliday junction resolvase
VRGQAVVASTIGAVIHAFPVKLQELRAMTEPRDKTPHPSPLTPHGTVLAFDFGEKRIGTAIGETAIGIAHPLTTIHAAEKLRRFAAITALINEWKPALLVVGLPSHLDGTEHEISRLARKFAGELSRRFALPVEFVDERLTSAAAESSLGESGVASHKRREMIDAVAAQHILQDYLDRHGRPA